MASNKMVRLCLTALTTTLTTNILNPPTLTGGVGSGGTSNSNTYFIIRQIIIVNKTANSATFSLWLGATGANAAGTEVIGSGQVIPANTTMNFPTAMRMDVADFLVGGSGTATALTIECLGEIGVA